MSLHIAKQPFCATVALTIFLGLAVGGSAQDAAPAAGSAAGHKSPAVKAKSVSGQWVFAPESDAASKLAWQYTPGESEFLALVIGCNAQERSSYVVVDLSGEGKVKGRLSAKITKGGQTLSVAGKVAAGESGPFVKSAVPYADLARLLAQPGDIVVALPRQKLGFSDKSLAGPYADFTKACRLR